VIRLTLRPASCRPPERRRGHHATFRHWTTGSPRTRSPADRTCLRVGTRLPDHCSLGPAWRGRQVRRRSGSTTGRCLTAHLRRRAPARAASQMLKAERAGRPLTAGSATSGLAPAGPSDLGCVACFYVIARSRSWSGVGGAPAGSRHQPGERGQGLRRVLARGYGGG
jgi:hypothetical protein